MLPWLPVGEFCLASGSQVRYKGQRSPIQLPKSSYLADYPSDHLKKEKKSFLNNFQKIIIHDILLEAKMFQNQLLPKRDKKLRNAAVYYTRYAKNYTKLGLYDIRMHVHTTSSIRSKAFRTSAPEKTAKTEESFTNYLLKLTNTFSNYSISGNFPLYSFTHRAEILLSRFFRMS